MTQPAPQFQPGSSAGQQAPALLAMIDDGVQVVDTRSLMEFANNHVAGTLNIPIDSFASYAPAMLDTSRITTVITQPEWAEPVFDFYQRIGITPAQRHFTYAVLDELQSAGHVLESYRNVSSRDVGKQVISGDLPVVDVRTIMEWQQGHIRGAVHIEMVDLLHRIDEIPRGKPVLLQCRSGHRSAVAASILQAHGIKDVINLNGGIIDWVNNGFPLER